MFALQKTQSLFRHENVMERSRDLKTFFPKLYPPFLFVLHLYSFLDVFGLSEAQALEVT